MKSKKVSAFTFILFVLGFLFALQYNTMTDLPERDTRDLWELRDELTDEKRDHSNLLTTLEQLDETYRKYETLQSGAEEQALKETVDQLRQRIGATDLEGEGLIVTVAPSDEAIALGENIQGISTDLLMRFVNDIHQIPGITLDIDGKRYTTLSAIRDINGVTTVNGSEVKSPPFYIYILTEDEETTDKVYNYLSSSRLIDEFYVDNLTMTIEKSQQPFRLRGSTISVRNDYLRELPKGEQ